MESCCHVIAVCGPGGELGQKGPEEGKKGLIQPPFTGTEVTDSPSLTEASWGAVLLRSPLSSAMGAPLLQPPLDLSCACQCQRFFFPSQS